MTQPKFFSKYPPGTQEYYTVMQAIGAGRDANHRARELGIELTDLGIQTKPASEKWQKIDSLYSSGSNKSELLIEYFSTTWETEEILRNSSNIQLLHSYQQYFKPVFDQWPEWQRKAIIKALFGQIEQLSDKEKSGLTQCLKELNQTKWAEPHLCATKKEILSIYAKLLSSHMNSIFEALFCHLHLMSEIPESRKGFEGCYILINQEDDQTLYYIKPDGEAEAINIKNRRLFNQKVNDDIKKNRTKLNLSEKSIYDIITSHIDLYTHGKTLSGWNFSVGLSTSLLNHIRSFGQMNAPSVDKEIERVCQFFREHQNIHSSLSDDELRQLIRVTAPFTQLTEAEVESIDYEGWLQRLALIDETKQIKKFLAAQLEDKDNDAIDEMTIQDVHDVDVLFDWLKKCVAKQLTQKESGDRLRCDLIMQGLKGLTNPFKQPVNTGKIVEKMTRQIDHMVRSIEKQVAKTRVMQFDKPVCEALSKLDSLWQDSSDLCQDEKVILAEITQDIVAIKKAKFYDAGLPKLLKEIKKDDVVNFYKQCQASIEAKLESLEDLRFQQQNKWIQTMQILATWVIKIISCGYSQNFFAKEPPEAEVINQALNRFANKVNAKIGSHAQPAMSNE